MASTLSDRINERRRELNMSQAELARLAGVKPPSVALWVNGDTQSIKGSHLLLAAAALGVTPTWLDSGRGPKFAAPAHTASEPGHAYQDPLIAEAVQLLNGMGAKARAEALSFLRIFAAKKTGS